MGPLINVYLVVTDNSGKVVHYESLEKGKDCDLNAFAKIVSTKQRALEKQFGRTEYTVHIGLADNLGALLQSFPDIKAPKPPDISKELEDRLVKASEG